MARKTMPAVRKRRCLSSEPALVPQEQEKLAASAAASAPEAVDASTSEIPSLPCAPVPDGPSFHPALSDAAYDNEHSAHVNVRSKRKRSHACKQKMEVPQLVEEMCKVLMGADSFHEGDAVDASCASDCIVLFGAKKAATSPSLMGFLKYLSVQVDNGMIGRHCMSALNGAIATETVGGFGELNLIQSKALTNSNSLLRSFSPPLGRIKKALYWLAIKWMEEQRNLSMRFLWQETALSALLNACLNSPGSTACMKKPRVGNASKQVANSVNLNNRNGAIVGQGECKIKCDKQDKVQMPSGLGEDKKTPAADFHLRTTHQLSPGELESWIAKHSEYLKKTEEETVLRPKSSEKVDGDCLEMGRDDCIEIEVQLSEKCGDVLEIKAAAKDGPDKMLYVERILKTLSLNRAHLDGQEEVIVLFKALRSDGKEIIVDNAFLRRDYPLLLVNFYEQRLHALVGN